MRFKNLLGLLAIGGAVAYAQKKRGGEMSLAGIKSSLLDAFNNVKGQLQGVMGQGQGQNTNPNQTRGVVGSSDVGTSDLGSVGGHDDIGSSTGYSQSSSYGSDIGAGTGLGGSDGTGIGRKY